MNQSNTLKTFFKYLVPSMLGMALVAVYTFTDSFVVGRELGAIALGAMGVCTPILTITYALGFLCGMGGGALYSISMGKNNKKNANKVYTTSFFMLVISGAALAVIGNIFAGRLARILGADDGNIMYVMPYLRCVVTFVPGFMLDVFLMTYMKNDGHPNVAMAATVTGTSLNVILDLLFVFVFKWGMLGAAIATCIGSFACSSISLIYIFSKKLNLVPRIKNIEPCLIFRIFKTGLSVFVLECSSGVVTLVFIQRAMQFYGTLGSSIYTVIMNWTLICFNLLMGIAQSVQPLISVSYGEGKFNRVRVYRKYAIISSVIAGAVFLLIGYIFTEPLVGVFAKDSAELIAKAAGSFRIYLPAYFIMGIGISIGIYFQSIEASSKSLVVMLARGIVLPVAGALVLPIAFDEAGLWAAAPIAELIAAAMAVLLVLKEKPCAAREASGAAESGALPPQLIITISREFGSGGREIGWLIGERLNIPVYDKAVGELTSAASGFDNKIIDSKEDEADFPFGLYAADHYTAISNEIYRAQSRTIEALASKGSCVIIGRCSDYILHGKFNTLNVFVHAPLEMRVYRVTEYDGCSPREAVRKIVQNDKAREEYHSFFTGLAWGRSQNYDLTVNSKIGVEDSARLIIEMAEMKTKKTAHG